MAIPEVVHTQAILKRLSGLYLQIYAFIYIYIYVIIIIRKNDMNLRGSKGEISERLERKGTWEGLEGGKGKEGENLCDYTLIKIW